MSRKFKLNPLLVAMMPLMMVPSTSHSFTQESQTNPPDTEEVKKAAAEAEEEAVEVIEVSGFRGSLQKAISQKRLADGIQDSIFAEDIGKSTDQNIADALSRVTGVTVQEADGEGTRISILTSSLQGSGGSNSGNDQSVDLSTISSDILSSIDVYKTSAADQDEGSLGASVVLRTVKPLNVAKDRRTVELQGRFNEFSDENDYKISGTLSQKFFDETFGVIVTVSDETQSTRRDEVTADWLRPYEAATIRAGGATTTTGQIVSETTGAIISNGRGYSTSLNDRDRFTVSSGMQWLASDSTDIQLNLSYSKQDVFTDSHRIGTSKPNLRDRGNLPDDPQQDWWTYDEASRTLVKSINRFGSGSLGRNVGGNETENKVATLVINQEITDDLRVELTAGYSKTEFESKPNANLGTSTWNFIPATVLENADLETLEPTGYDCSSGSCQIVVGTTPFIYVPEGINNNQSNIATSGFNPLDPYSNHLGFVSKYDELTDDTNKSIYLDFDYDVDFVGVTQLEFGAKWSSRVKDVGTNYQTISSPGQTVFDPETGMPVAGLGPADIALADVIVGQGIPVPDFMEGLISNNSQYSSEFLNGWGILDPDSAFEQIFSIPDVALQPNRTGDRRIEQDNVSLYAKMNFEYMDSRLTGNFGVRYVKTDVLSFGNSALSFHDRDRVFDPNELVYENGLLNTANEPCTPFSNANQTTRIEGEYPCYEPLLSPEGVLQVNYDENGSVIGIDRNDASTRSWWALYRHTDASTQARFSEDIFGEGDTTSIFRRVYSGIGENSNSVLLPSLNLNYALNDEMIARFAVSRTMARPGFDQLRPGFSFNENVWGEFSRANVNNPNLKPLKSDNIDLSFEWYFDKTGLFSVALFNKDMTDFVETVRDTIYVTDVRRDYDRTSLNLDEFIIPIADGVNPQTANCHPDRQVQDRIREALRFACEPVEAVLSRNGASVKTKGVELNFTKDLTMLPGLLSGLGVSLNYTYADSETEAEVLELTGRELKALPQLYTPKHSANNTIFWAKDGHQVRLAHRYNGVQLVNRGLTGGLEWQDSTSRLDLSGAYQYNEDITITFHALNLTDDSTRTFFTSAGIDLGDVDENGDPVPFVEGDAIEGEAYKGRTIREFKTGRNFRVGIRVNF